MRSPRGCRSLFRFKGRAPNRFNWHLRPWTQHKSLGRLREREGVEWEVGVAKTEGRRNNRIICICNTLLGQFLDSKWIWTRNDCNVREARQARTTGRQEGQEDRLGESKKFDKFEKPLGHGTQQLRPHGRLNETIRTELRLQRCLAYSPTFFIIVYQHLI